VHCVAVIVPAYNRPRFLREALESLCVQTLAPAEVVVVDDGSTEDLRSVCERFPQVTYVRQDNAGPSAARNRGLDHTSADFVVFLDNDDRLHPEALEIGATALAEREDLGFVFGLPRPIASDGTPITWNLPQPPGHADYASLLACEHVFAPAGFMARRSAVNAAGRFNESIAAGEECDLWRRIARDSPVRMHGKVIFDYRIHGSNLSDNASAMLTGTLVMHLSHLDFVRRSGQRRLVEAYRRGRRFWIALYGPALIPEMLIRLRRGHWRLACDDLGLLLRYYPVGLPEYGISLLSRALRKLRRLWSVSHSKTH
jgi:glycosyltransferase involved in cell wall biosynthesis